jgi:MFS superfamily sulfate permease-like transporter
VALILFVEKLSHGQFELVINDENKKVVGSIAGESLENLKDHSHTLVYSIKGELAYLNAEAHIARFEHNLGDYDNIVLRLRELYFIDLDGVDAFEEIVQIVEAQGKQVFVTGISPLIEKMLEDSKSFVRLRKKGNVYQKTSQALSKLGYPDLTYKEVPVAEKDVEKKDNPKTRIKKK